MLLVVQLQSTYCHQILYYLPTIWLCYRNQTNGFQLALINWKAFVTKCQPIQTIVIIFNKGGMEISRFRFHVTNQKIDAVQSYCYFLLFALKQIDSPHHAQLTISLLDRLVLPVMRYVIEVLGPYFISKSKWSPHQFMLEPLSVKNINLHLCRFLLGVSRKVTNDAVMGEIGRLPKLLMTVRRWIPFTKGALRLPRQIFLNVPYLCH